MGWSLPPNTGVDAQWTHWWECRIDSTGMFLQPQPCQPPAEPHPVMLVSGGWLGGSASTHGPPLLGGPLRMGSTSLPEL